MGHVIYPIVVSTMDIDKSLLTYFENFGTPITVPVVAWYVNADGKDVLIDTASSKEVNDACWWGGSEHVQTFEEGLGKLGKKPEDIDYLIITHLHFDHCAEAGKCKNAKVIVQEEELRFAYSPHATCARMYPKELFVDLKFNVVNGEKEIVPGIRVIPAPGHSPGTQAVGIETDKGLAVITGFCASNANFEVPDEKKVVMPVLPPGIHCDMMQSFDSALKIKGMADILIPVHEDTFAYAERIPE